MSEVNVSKYPARVRFRGIGFEFGDDVIIVPSLTVGQTEGLVELLVKHDAIKVEDFKTVDEKVQIRSKIIFEAVKRNYPEFTEVELNEFVTGANNDKLFYAAMGSDRTSKQIKEVGEFQPGE